MRVIAECKQPPYCRTYPSFIEGIISQLLGRLRKTKNTPSAHVYLSTAPAIMLSTLSRSSARLAARQGRRHAITASVGAINEKHTVVLIRCVPVCLSVCVCVAMLDRAALHFPAAFSSLAERCLLVLCFLLLSLLRGVSFVMPTTTYACTPPCPEIIALFTVCRACVSASRIRLRCRCA